MLNSRMSDEVLNQQASLFNSDNVRRFVESAVFESIPVGCWPSWIVCEASTIRSLLLFRFCFNYFFSVLQLGKQDVMRLGSRLDTGYINFFLTCCLVALLSFTTVKKLE
jgi:hypothetical protein